ncbi:anthrone oxygenase family protein [Friedmanniella luteola]|uniref:anthrone oxygenase family protein n=1 Tax=Friedmanniella luteola TaxID=546871 RepID=UPI0012FD2A1F
MSRWVAVVETAHVTTLAAVVGIVAVDPFARMRSAADWSGWLAGQQRLDRVMSRAAPPLLLSATATAAGASLVAFGQHEIPLATGRALAAGCVAAAVAVTLVVNEPMNTRLRAWSPLDAPPDDWRAVREQWDRGHGWRRALLALAAFASGWGAARSRTDPRSRPRC